MTSFTDFVASRPAAEQAEADILHYTEVLIEALTMDAPEGYSYAIDGGRKYHKVWMTTGGGNRSIHAFIDKKTGDKIELHSGEPAGPLSAYLDPDVLRECMALIDAVE